MLGKVFGSEYFLELTVELSEFFESPFCFETGVANLSEYEVAALILVIVANVPNLLIDEHVPAGKFVQQIYFRFDSFG